MAARGSHRAVVVDDSQFMRTVIADILEGGGVEVVAEARNGREGVAAVADHDPDVVTMDVEMPVMDGIEAVERIMDDHPTPILMLSAHTDDGADVTFDALERGAVDFFTKPGGEVSVEMSGFDEQLVEKVSEVARADVPANGADHDTSAVSPATAYVDDPTVIIGASTGGPSVVERVLAGLPAGADCRVLVVQHMPDEFTGRFAERLDRASDYDVREAGDRDRVAGGEAVVAPGGRHLEVTGYRGGRVRVSLSDDPPVNGVRPAIDVTMRSAAGTIDDPLVGVVLTGMGRDGVAGIRRIADAGGRTITQDEATSSVFGMPKRAIETGRVDAVLPAGDVAQGIVDALREDR